MKKALFLLISNAPDGGDSKPASPKSKQASELVPDGDTVAPGSNTAESPEAELARLRMRNAELETESESRRNLDANSIFPMLCGYYVGVQKMTQDAASLAVAQKFPMLAPKPIAPAMRGLKVNNPFAIRKIGAP